MIFFRVTNSINIKITDGSILKYDRFKAPVNIENETVYITTYDDFQDLKEIFAKVDKNRYSAKVVNEDSVRDIQSFPIELGVSFKGEQKLRYEIGDISFLELKEQELLNNLKSFHKSSIKVAVIGSLGDTISKMISSMAALRIFYEKLKEIYKNVDLDIFIKASNNSYFNRDKSIYQTQKYINNIYPLSTNTKAFCQYDYFVDNSIDISKNLDINIVDAWLYKFGIDYKKVNNLNKYSEINIDNFELTKDLKNQIEKSKKRGKLLLFHPYSASINKSIPQNFAIEILKALIDKLDDYIIVSTLLIDPKIKSDNFVDLSSYSKTIEDFIYIVSSMDKVLTAETSALHIADSFMIPTLCISTNDDENIMKYYKNTKSIFVKDSSKNLSKFIYENDLLTINKFEEWKKLKIEDIIKILESF
ncbi:glycosyltransferase family 9 protein [Aliarcobacter thereius]|uniref:glycosyltransferase family 9 protein n=1 Tax=Aliarcobacter thereius TaxID=544718 RepID=UPI0010FDEFA8|nr:glycosyltransferase family 9 protein [Aliarcobacter thereius]TLT08001.1 glycosyltransferase family 9 protein [Aliarcobacter thereius]